MLSLYRSNQMAVLRNHVIACLRESPLPHPLLAEHVVVQNQNIGQWLLHGIAEKLGIAAGLSLSDPTTFLHNLLTRLQPDTLAPSPFRAANMTWMLMELLPQWLDHRDAAALKQYVGDDGSGVKLYQLATNIAALFCRYMTWRPDWMVSDFGAFASTTDELPGCPVKGDFGGHFSRFEEVANKAEQAWQPLLWQALCHKVRQADRPAWHLAEGETLLLKRLGQPDVQARLPSRIFLCQNGPLSPVESRLFTLLARHCDVHILMHLPCTGERQGHAMHPLTQSMAGPVVNAMTATVAGNGPVVEQFVQPQGKTLLHCVQKALIQPFDPASQKVSATVINSDDHSLAFHCRHSALREVEAVQNYLLSRFDEDRSLTPSDVVILVPDINSYAPWFQTVFGGAPAEHYIPFMLSDVNSQAEQPLLLAFGQILNLNHSRATAVQLLELLEVEAIARRFAMAMEEVETLSGWIRATGIRWGFNPAHVSAFDLPARQDNTWIFGLRRMLLGYAMPESMGPYHAIVPCDLVQGMSAELAGKLADFLEQCEWLLEELPGAKTAEQWTLFVTELVGRFFQGKGDDEKVLATLSQTTRRFYRTLKKADYQAPVSQKVVQSWFAEQLNRTAARARSAVGHMTVAALTAHRTLPYRIVCLLGMNDGVFPRTSPAASFDLTTLTARESDGSAREQARHLFLQTLLAPEQALYISYISRTIRDNSERFPSVLVAELQHFIDQNYTLPPPLANTKVAQHCTHQHTLQPFHEHNFQSGSRAHSYARQWLPAATGGGVAVQPFVSSALTCPKTEQDAGPPDLLELDDLLKFWKNPCQAFCQQRLKLYLDKPEEQDETREPFELDGLTAWQLHDRLLHHHLGEGDDDSFAATVRASGVLPHGAFGDIILEQLSDSAQQTAETISPWIRSAATDLRVQIDCGATTISGWLANLHAPHGQVLWQSGKIREHHCFAFWIKHLCYSAANSTPVQSICLGRDKGFVLTAIEPEQATSWLTDLTTLYRQGLSSPLPFFHKTATAWLTAMNSGAVPSGHYSQQDEADQQAYRIFYGSRHIAAEGEDLYIRRCWPELEAAFPRFRELTHTLLRPLFSCYEPLSDDDCP